MDKTKYANTAQERELIEKTAIRIMQEHKHAFEVLAK